MTKEAVPKPGGPLDGKGLLGSDTLGFGTLGHTSPDVWADARIGWGFFPGLPLQINEGAL